MQMFCHSKWVASWVTKNMDDLPPVVADVADPEPMPDRLKVFPQHPGVNGIQEGNACPLA